MTDLTINKGETFQRVWRWETLPFVYSAITGITKAAPAVITSPSHGLVSGWRAGVISAGGMRQINAKKVPPRSSELHKVTFVSSSSISFNEIDSSRYTTYTSGGYLVSYTPVSLSGFAARMKIRATVESTGDPLVSLVSPTNIALDDTNHTITVTIAATATDDYDFATGVYDLELESGSGVVTRLDAGNVFVTEEVTR